MFERGGRSARVGGSGDGSPDGEPWDDGPRGDEPAGGSAAGELDCGRLPGRLRTPSADDLESTPPGPQLVDVVALTDPTGLDEYALVELVAAWARLTSWTQARAAEAAAELARRGRMTVPPRAPEHETSAPVRRHEAGRGRQTTPRSAAAHELALRLCVTRDAAQRLIDLGRALAGPLTPVGAALSAGEIDLGRARAFADGLRDVPMPVAVAVQDVVLPSAPRRTARQVAQDVAAALVSVDEVEATRRHRRARTGRRVHHPAALPDGMAGIWAVLPAADAVALDLALDAAATAARSRGDERTSDQLRADALAAVGHAALGLGWIGAPPASTHGSPDAPPPVATGSRGAEPGPAGSPWPGDDAADSTIAPTPETFLVGTVGGRAPRVHVTVPLGVLLPPGPAPGAPGGSPFMSGAGAGAGSRPAHPRPDAQPSDPDPDRDPPDVGRPVRGEVAWLEGYGPVTPDVARALALGGVWSRLVTDPLSGVVRDVGRSRYRPPAELAELVRARDGTCVRPGCGTHARSCDLDHTVPFHHGGATAEWNLTALCPTDHRLKTAGGMVVRWRGPGVVDVELPSGHTYRREPDGTATLLPRGAAA